jgi:hypothetical protein
MSYSNMIGHGVMRCACGAEMENCGCPDHQGITFVIVERCEACAPLEQVLAVEDQSSILSDAMAIATIADVLGIDPQHVRGSNLRVLLEVASIKQTKKLTDEVTKTREELGEFRTDFKKTVNWVKNTFEP